MGDLVPWSDSWLEHLEADILATLPDDDVTLDPAWALKLVRHFRATRDSERETVAYINEAIGAGLERDEALNLLSEARECFQAAYAEGLVDALANGDIDRIRDIWERRIGFVDASVLSRLGGPT